MAWKYDKMWDRYDQSNIVFLNYNDCRINVESMLDLVFIYIYILLWKLGD